MSDYKILGLGNPLIDLLIQTSDQVLEQLNVNKNSMNLVDEDRQKELLKYFEQKEVKQTVGGSCGNSMVMLSQLGEKAAFVGKTGDDELGLTYKEKMNETGVVSLTKNTEGMTGSTVILVTEDGSRTMNTHLGKAVELNTEDIVDDEVKDANYVYVEGYLWDADQQKKAVEKAVVIAKNSGVQVSLTLSDPFCVSRHKDTFILLIKEYVDILFCNEEELAHLAEQGSFEENLKWVGSICNHVICTRSEKGAEVLINGVQTHVDAFEAKVLDTTGAGDSFAAGYLFGLMNGFDTEKSATLGAYCAKVIIEQIGPRYDGDFKKLVEEYL